MWSIGQEDCSFYFLLLIATCKQVVISDVAQAESLIAQGMLKRCTAMTNSNSQSRFTKTKLSIISLYFFLEWIVFVYNNVVVTFFIFHMFAAGHSAL